MRKTTPAVSFREQGESTTETHSATLAYDRDFLQTRLALFALTLALFALAFYLIAFALSLVGGDESAGLPENGDLHLIPLFSATYGLVWWLCRGRELTMRTLHAIDAGALLVAGLLFAWSEYLVRDNLVAVSNHATAAFTVVARAALVPGTTRRCAALSLLVFVPLFIVAFFVWDRPSASWPEGVDRPSYALFVARGLFWAALATVVTRVIHGLRREVRKAQRLGQYELIEKIGEGGMGQVYRARHAMLQRPTAVKLLLRGLESARDVARFEREVQLTCRLTHPNTISIFDYGRTPDGVFYYAMEFLEGVDLERLVRSDGAQCPARAVHILKQVCASLDEAHRRGMVHRDIKPANIILCRDGWRYDAVKVVDFGLVKDVELSGDLGGTSDDTILGTPHYMSPECYLDAGSVDRQSDLYALGCVGYYLVTGRPVFEANGIAEILVKHRRESPRRPSEINPGVPEDLEEVLLQCLRKDPDQRPASAADLLAALEDCGDVPDWSEEEASAWWRDRSPAPPASARQDDDRSEAETVVVKES